MSATWSSRSGTRSDSRALRSGCPCGRRRARGRARGACDGEPQGRLGARRSPAEGIPAGWTAKEFVGHASVELVRDEARLALRLRSERSSFALYRDVVVDLNEFPFLSWSWKVVRLPADGDVRDRAADDQA